MPEGAWLGRDLAGCHPPWDHGVPVPVSQRALELQPGGTDQPAEARYKVVFCLQYKISLGALAPRICISNEVKWGSNQRMQRSSLLPRSGSCAIWALLTQNMPYPHLTCAVCHGLESRTKFTPLACGFLSETRVA